MNIEEIVRNQRTFYTKGETRDVSFRINALQKLRAMLLASEPKIYAALKSDLNKSEFEAYMSELGMVLDELRFLISHTRQWAAKKYVPTPLAQFYANSYQVAEPYGVVLIMAPWNYPLQLSLDPLIGALAAGNCVVLKPSAYAPQTSKLLGELLAQCFPPEYVSVVQGGRQENADLLKQRFDYILFTGSVEIGKLVMESAAKFLTPVSLELGGKSPCIIDQTADLKIAARRLAFGKLLNAGQTCIAPDYLFVQTCVKDQLVAYIKAEIVNFYGEKPLENDDYPKMINEKHFARIKALIENEHILLGGRGNERLQIEPTLLDGITGDSPVMQEEIFGPILPILTFEKIDEVIAFVAAREKPLALYLFTKDKSVEKRVLNELSFGGGCINDTIVHVATSYMSFGGVGHSGMGSYHGKASFDTFSHYKKIVKKAFWIDLPFRYFPVTKAKEWFLRLFLH
jgi:aldehyde dehydrogenase (NAD+)